MDKYAEDLYIAGQIIAEGFMDKLAEELEKDAISPQLADATKKLLGKWESMSGSIAKHLARSNIKIDPNIPEQVAKLQKRQLIEKGLQKGLYYGAPVGGAALLTGYGLGRRRRRD